MGNSILAQDPTAKPNNPAVGLDGSIPDVSSATVPADLRISNILSTEDSGKITVAS